MGQKVDNSISLQTGAGLAPQELARWKSALPATTLASLLTPEPAFWEHVTRVRAGEDARDLAGAYGNGKVRRQVLASYLETGARGPHESAITRVLGIAATASFTQAPREPGDPKNAYRPDFRQAVLVGAACIARRGAGKCLVCGKQLTDRRAAPVGGPTERTSRQDCCPDHRHYGMEDYRKQAVHLVFHHVASALAQTFDDTG